MIHRIYANKTSFRAIEFQPGLNVILADRTRLSSSKDTRNGLGKSLLLAIIDYCLAGSGTDVRIEPLRSWAFTLDITVLKNRVQVTRYVENDNQIFIEGPTENWAIQPVIDTETGQRFLSSDQWRIVLGQAFFGTPSDPQKYQPTFRSLFPYFMRVGQRAYTDPFSHYPRSKRWQKEVAITYLLGLNWGHALRWEEYRVQEEKLKGYAKYLQDEDTSLGEMETKLINLKAQLSHDKKALDSFRILPQYEQIERQANDLTAAIQVLVNQNITLKRRQSQYNKAVQSETPPNEQILEELYKEVGIVFPDGMKRTLDEARNFHQQILANRRTFLENEIQELFQRIQHNLHEIEEKTNQRAQLLQILGEHGALQEWTLLKDHYVATKTEEDRLFREIQEIKENKNKIKDIKIARTNLSRLADQDKDDRIEIWSEAVQWFNDLSMSLYNQPGKLVLDIDESGYKFEINIGRGASDGVSHMKVFCFDALLLKLWSGKQKMDFLAHDSIMFDPVDSRQRATALSAMAKITNESGTQYICTFNSDAFPFRDLASINVEFQQFINPVRLTDKEPEGCLCGFRFESQPLLKSTSKRKRSKAVNIQAENNDAEY